ncbi:site-specific integrase [Vibrio aestuarianus]|uniref:Site-specific integrase n=1 Tax=Vibrio aestuarianus TaxID=28171 RepID=A0AAX3U160_9VIBR|nr:site-specific integrase [Vibrio aestuarianus]WGK80558.1 site-specific integrase [Vibrio aestuarianus]
MLYLSQRDSGIWYFRYQVPPQYRSHFNGREIKKSLRTRCRITAKLRSAKLQQTLWESLELLEKRGDKSDKLSAFYSVMSKVLPIRETHVWGFSDGEKQKIITKFTDCLETLEADPNLVRAQKSRIALREEETSEFIQSIELIESLWDRNATPLQAANAYLETIAHRPNSDNPHYYEEIRNVAISLCRFVRDFQRSLDSLNVVEARAILEQVKGYEWHDYKQVSIDKTADDYWQREPQIESVNTESTQAEKPQVTPQKAKDIVSIEAVLESYKLEKINKKSDKKGINAVIVSCRLVHELLGCSDMANVSRDDVNRIIPDIKAFPANARSLANRKHFADLNCIEIIEKNKDLGLPLRKESQAMRDIERASTVYRWAILHNKITYNPFEGLCYSKSKTKTQRVVGLVDDDKDKKVPFTSDDLKKIFSHPVYTQGQIGHNTRDRLRLHYQYWVMLIVLTTGARPNEICQLRLADIKYIEDVLCFLVQAVDDDQSVKNEAAVRIIPVPDVLFKLGFQSYLDSVAGSRMLFPDLTYTDKSGYYGKVEDWFSNTFSTPMGLSAQSKSLYSMRHTFIFDYQKRGARCPIVQQLVGHKNGNITDDTYGGRFDVAQLKAKIEEYNVEPILEQVLPWRPLTYR